MDTTKIFLLSFLNDILKNNGYHMIDDIIDFEIDRKDLVNKKNKKIVKDHSDILFLGEAPLFDKTKCGYYKRYAPNYVVNVTRGLLRQIEYKLVGEYGEITTTIEDGETIYHNEPYFYYVEKLKKNK